MGITIDRQRDEHCPVSLPVGQDDKFSPSHQDHTYDPQMHYGFLRLRTMTEVAHRKTTDSTKTPGKLSYPGAWQLSALDLCARLDQIKTGNVATSSLSLIYLGRIHT
ncbi:hypothetical protein NX059_002142 [Plenodomus lindquistii]|nr:hypothetical protein NX059_002142 [Plenodomus lindquistii]